MKRQKPKQKMPAAIGRKGRAEGLYTAHASLAAMPSLLRIATERARYPTRLHRGPVTLNQSGYPEDPPTPEDIVAAARIVRVHDEGMPEMLRAMADMLDGEMEAVGFDADSDKTYQLVYWRAAGLATTVFGDPTDAESWAEALNSAFWTAWNNCLMPFIENERDYDVH